MLAIPKPVKKEKASSWGVKRKYSKPKKFKKTMVEVTGSFMNNKSVMESLMHGPDYTKYSYLFTPYYPGIAKIPQELYDKVKARSKGICEICGKEKSEEVHHLAGRRRIACMENLLDTSMKCHKPPSGIHANKEIYEREMKKMQDRYFAMGFTEDEVRWLLGTKSRRLF